MSEREAELRRAVESRMHPVGCGPCREALTALIDFHRQQAREEAIQQIADRLCPEGSSLRAICGADYYDRSSKQAKQRVKCLPHAMLAESR